MYFQVRSSFGLYPVHLAVSKRDRIALASNYWGASVSAYALEGTSSFCMSKPSIFESFLGTDYRLSEAPFLVEQFKDAGSGVLIEKQVQEGKKLVAEKQQ